MKESEIKRYEMTMLEILKKFGVNTKNIQIDHWELTGDTLAIDIAV